MTTKQRATYASTSAADDGDLDAIDDDGPEVVWLDEPEDDAPARRPRASSWLDDFDFDDYRDDRWGDSVGSIWGRYGSRAAADSAERVVAAQRIAQGIVDTFATGDLNYRVTFDPLVQTAGTDIDAKVVRISHKPLFDPSLTADEANVVVTAMAAHEAAHVRYGLAGFRAVRAMEKADPRAHHLSNILADVHDERCFARDYPGYGSELFDPALAYVARKGLEAAGLQRLDPSRVDAIGLVGAAVRYDRWADWTAETRPERDWWRDWADRWSTSDKPRDHVAAVAEGLAHLGPPPATVTLPGPTAPQPGGGDGQPADGGGDPAPPEEGGNPAPGRSPLPDCWGEGIVESDVDAPLTDQEAQEAVQDARSLVDEPATGTRGQVYWTPRPALPKGRRNPSPIAPDLSASAAIREAFARSRTGRLGRVRGLRQGRLDNRSLPRVASNDFRLFSRRIEQSEGRYLVWLMVDLSGSMAGRPLEQATSVAAQLAAALRNVPSVELDVWAWATPFKPRYGAALRPDFGAVRVYHSGDPIAAIGYLGALSLGGTPDGAALAWATRAIRRTARRGQTPVILFASDGQGDLGYRKHPERITLGAALPGGDIVGDARRQGVEVVSIALGGIDEDYQRDIYGARGYVPWAGSIQRMARPIGRLLARIVAGQTA